MAAIERLSAAVESGDGARAAVILRQLLDGPIRVVPFMRIDGKRVVGRRIPGQRG